MVWWYVWIQTWHGGTFWNELGMVVHLDTNLTWFCFSWRQYFIESKACLANISSLDFSADWRMPGACGGLHSTQAVTWRWWPVNNAARPSRQKSPPTHGSTRHWVSVSRGSQCKQSCRECIFGSQSFRYKSLPSVWQTTDFQWLAPDPPVLITNHLTEMTLADTFSHWLSVSHWVCQWSGVRCMPNTSGWLRCRIV